MTVMKKTEQKDDAVSPVVGVMLMLVVTIIIAAVVAAFASGVATDVEPAPSTVLKAEVDSAKEFAIYDLETWDIREKHGSGTVILTSLNGDAINLNKIVVTVTNATGHSVAYSAPIYGYASGETLEAGESMNLGYSVDSARNGFGLSYLGTTVNPGEFAHVVVIYDDSHILYDKEVLVQ